MRILPSQVDSWSVWIAEEELMTHPNEQLLRRIDEAQEQGDLDGFFSYYTDDVVAHLPGKSSLAGDYRGQAQMREAFGRFMQSIGEYSFKNHAYLADDEHGVVLQHSRSVRDGKTLELDETFVIHFRDGKVSEFWYQPVDQAAFDAWVG
jgi:ketosteroid isomerase-like protein